MSSSKNLKVYRTEFVADIKQMQFKVKFPCQLKIIWKRSNESAETTLVPVEKGAVNFNQSLHLFANMYFNTDENKFVEKKSIFSFMIITEKGEKSAGSVTFDLGDFLNSRQYEVEKDFPLSKCPIPDTKIKMKIFYNESKESGYDTMSQISSADNTLDMSTASVNIEELAPEKKEESEKSGSQQKEQKYESLSEVDVDNKTNETEDQKSSRISSTVNASENLQALNQITGKINDFVSKCSGGIKNQIENLKLKNKTLQEKLSVEKFERQKLEEQSTNNTKSQGIQKEFATYKLQRQAELTKQKDKSSELLQKLEQSKKLCESLQSNASSGEANNNYIAQLKTGFEEQEQKMKDKIEELNEQLLNENRMKNEFEQKLKHLQTNHKALTEKYEDCKQKKEILEKREESNQKEIEGLRRKLESTYEALVDSLGNMLN